MVTVIRRVRAGDHGATVLTGVGRQRDQLAGIVCNRWSRTMVLSRSVRSRRFQHVTWSHLRRQGGRIKSVSSGIFAVWWDGWRKQTHGPGRIRSQFYVKNLSPTRNTLSLSISRLEEAHKGCHQSAVRYGSKSNGNRPRIAELLLAYEALWLPFEREVRGGDVGGRSSCIWTRRKVMIRPIAH